MMAQDESGGQGGQPIGEGRRDSDFAPRAPPPATVRQAIVRRRKLVVEDSGSRSTSTSSARSEAGHGGSGGGKLARRLGALDLTLLGVGATLGAGVYVLAGVVAKKEAGPAIVVSFLVAGFASILSGLCYAEFGARVPRAGSAYLYSYVTVGELAAWVAGWNLILEYIIAAASVARAWSGYLDLLLGGSLSAWIDETLGVISMPGLGSRIDFVSLLVVLLLTAFLVRGVKESSRLSSALTVLNLIVIAFVIIGGLSFANFDNWSNFAPFGFSGVFSGAATSFFGYVGFDVVAGMSEEAVKPQRSIPVAIIASLAICCVAYVGIGTAVTLMVPYTDIDIDAPLAAAFGGVGLGWAKSIVAVGAICGLSTSLIGSIFPLPRIVYAIADDGLLFPWLAEINQWATPGNATIATGLFAGLMAALFDIASLAEMMSIGTLGSYSLVAACVIILRHRAPEVDERASSTEFTSVAASADDKASEGDERPAVRSRRRGTRVLWLWTMSVESAATTHVFIFSIFACLLGLVGHADVLSSGVASGSPGAISLLIVSILGMVGSTVALYRLPTFSTASLSFKCPGVPLVPLASLLVNFYLIMSLGPPTWIRFAVWMVIGMGIYCFWGMSHSRVGREASHDELQISLTAHAH